MAGDYETVIRTATSAGGHPNGPRVLVARRPDGANLRLTIGGRFLDVFLNLEQCEAVADALMEPVWNFQNAERQRQQAVMPQRERQDET
ncbi:hypothetical protein [Mycolicibacterium septicum]|uniref:hypothetical protein n=1 Tax=Mycolicibacterium septicum TaxID=98668 RepID=UPI001AF9F05A|nr:hypothetical protein [Mycolicibacterium septicum]QRY53394.1 hypothetical protein JVX95_08775 [Mycolicibacterium septicum]